MGKLTDANRNIRWIEKFCRIPEGTDVGKPVRLRKWQRDIIRGIYDTPTRRCIISFGRKNAKTTLSAFLCLLHLCGPEARPNSQLYSAAQSRDQAAILFGLAAKIVRMSPDLSQVIVVRDTAKQLFCAEIGTLYKALSAEASTAYGLSPVFVVHDELGQVHGPRSELYEALETASAAHKDPLSIVISTQAPTDSDLLSRLIDDAATNADPEIKLFLYTADRDADPFDEKTIRQANPAFGDFQNAKEVMAEAENARRMPAGEASFRNLILNQRVEVNAPYVSASIWKENGGAPLDDWGDMPVYAGLDLSESRDLTALILATRDGDLLHVKPTFWLPEEGLAERSMKDRVPYDLWREAGFLRTCPGRTVEYEFVAHHMRDVFDRMNVKKVAFDRWNWRHLMPWLDKAGFSADEMENQFEEFGQGFQSMSPALRDLDSVLLNGRMRHGMHPVLGMCAANAVVKTDPANNRKLVKMTSTSRIDGMVALAMAVSVLARDWESDQQSYTLSRGVMVL